MSHRLAILCALSLCLFACKKGEAPGSPPPPPSPPTESSAALKAQTIAIQPSAGAAAIKLALVGEQIDVEAFGQHVIGKSKNDKRYYKREDGAAFVEVKGGEDGFKLRAPDDKLLWKIKISDDKIKVSDNEENAHPWQLKTKHDDQIKVLDPNETEIGEVRLNAESGKIKVKDAQGSEQFVVSAGGISAAYGVLLMQGVPSEYRGVIVAELIARGR